MTLAYTFALLSTLLGTALGLVGGQGRVAGPLRSFAFVAAIAVVFGQLLPEALSEAGPIVLWVFAAGLLVPRLLFHHHHGPGHGHGHTYGPDRYDDDAAHIRAGLLLSLVAMMLHQVGDGVALGAFASGAHAHHLHVDVFFAIAAHTVPVVGLLVHAFVQHWGRGIAAAQGVALALSGLLGVALANAINASAAAAWTPYITACAAGLLIHVVSHDRPPTGERDRFARVMDVLAVVAGVALVTQGGHAHGEPAGGAHHEGAHGVIERLLELSLDAAPALLLGLFLGALWQSGGLRTPAGDARHQSPLALALRGAVAGAPLPLCSCAVLPAAHAARRAGGAAAFVVAFLLAAPQLSAESLLMTGRFLGWELALLRLVGALVVASCAAYAAGRVLREKNTSATPTDARSPRQAAAADEPRVQRAARRLDELFVHILPFTMVGLLAATYADLSLGAGSLSVLRQGSLDLLVVTLVATPMYVCAASAAPLAAVLITKGLSPGAALVGLVLGPATSLATLGFMRASLGARATVAATLSAVASAWLLGLGVNALALRPDVLAHDSAAHGHGPLAYVSLGLLVLWLLRTVYLHGTSALFDGLKVSRFDPRQGHTGHDPRANAGASTEPPSATTSEPGHGHAHGHGHTHGHGHAHGHDTRR